MDGINLRRLISRNRDLISGIIDLIVLYQMPVSVWDMHGNVLINPTDLPDDPASEIHPIMIESHQLGLVRGSKAASLIAVLLNSAASFEVEKRALGREVLDCYRELKLLYSLSGKLASSLHLKEMAMVALEEANRLISASLGAVLWAGNDTEEDIYLASFGDETALDACLETSGCLASVVARRGRSEIVNNITYADSLPFVNSQVHSMICAPLNIKTQAKTKSLGIILLASQAEVIYTAGDLELLNTVATQAAPALEQAFLHEKELDEAKKREAKMQRKIQELTTEIDKAIAIMDKQADEIMNDEGFKRLQTMSENLRLIMNS